MNKEKSAPKREIKDTPGNNSEAKTEQASWNRQRTTEELTKFVARKLDELGDFELVIE